MSDTAMGVETGGSNTKAHALGLDGLGAPQGCAVKVWKMTIDLTLVREWVCAVSADVSCYEPRISRMEHGGLAVAQCMAVLIAIAPVALVARCQRQLIAC